LFFIYDILHAIVAFVQYRLSNSYKKINKVY